MTIQVGPAKDSTASFYDEESDKFVHVIRQSSLSTFVQVCPDRARMDMVYPERRKESSQALIGTAVHAGIELAVNTHIETGEWISPEEMLDIAWRVFLPIAAQDNFIQNNDSLENCRQLIWEAICKWVGQVRPQLRPAFSELTFKGLRFYEDDERIILANGTVDYGDSEKGLFDWKTSSRQWMGSGGSAWEKWRNDIQSVLYQWAAVQLGAVDEDADFTFAVMTHGKPNVELLTLPHRPDRLLWVQQLALDWARLNESNVERWSRNDSSALCSPKWCDHWSHCKGAYTILTHKP